MKNEFQCPKCKAFINIGDSLIFATKTKDNIGGIILLSPELGNYKVIKHPSYDYKEGDKLDFHCPSCNFKLTSKENENLAEIIMLDENGTEFKVFFSKIIGEQSTYMIKGKTVSIYGKDSDKYLDFFNLSKMK